MGKYDGATIELLNWRKYNPRPDSKKPSWFRLETSFCTGQDYFDLPPNQKWGWVMLMSTACDKNGDPFTLRYQWLKMFTNLVEKEIEELIEYFVQKGALRVSRTGVARDTHDFVRDTPATDGRTDEHTHARDAHKCAEFDFESLYKKYPNKKGKQKGLAACKRQIKNAEQYAELSAAVDSYAAECRREKTEKRFIKHFSTFMNCWPDYLPENASKPPLGGQEQESTAHLDEFRRKREEARLAGQNQAS